MAFLKGPFAHKRAGVLVRLPADQRQLLARLLDDVHQLLEPEPSIEPVGEDLDEFALLEAALKVEPPRDAAVARLLPDASRDDPELAASYRRLTEQGLRESKRGALATAAAALRRPDPVTLTEREANDLLRGLNDVRLVVAQRLGIEEEQDAEDLHERLSNADPDQLSEAERSDLAMGSLYEALTYWQDSLVNAVR